MMEPFHYLAGFAWDPPGERSGQTDVHQMVGLALPEYPLGFGSSDEGDSKREKIIFNFRVFAINSSDVKNGKMIVFFKIGENIQ